MERRGDPLRREEHQSSDRGCCSQAVPDRGTWIHGTRLVRDQRHEHSLSLRVPQAHAEAEPQLNVNRQKLVGTHCQHQDIGIRGSAGSRYTGRRRFQIFKAE